jgi:hypothetical protein
MRTREGGRLWSRKIHRTRRRQAKRPGGLSSTAQRRKLANDEWKCTPWLGGSIITLLGTMEAVEGRWD